jgi:HEPN domain-containing protein
MQPDRFATAQHWLATAEQDYAVALRLADEMPNVACFHAQQAAEKALKAALVARCGDSARDHSIVALLSECESSGIATPEGIIDDARRLDKFYVSSRYPDALGGLDPTKMFGRSEAIEAADRCRRFVDFARSIVARESSSVGESCAPDL